MDVEIVGAIFVGIATLVAAAGAVVHKVFREWMDARAEELKAGSTVAVMREVDVRRIVREEFAAEQRLFQDRLDRDQAALKENIELQIRVAVAEAVAP